MGGCAMKSHAKSKIVLYILVLSLSATTLICAPETKTKIGVIYVNHGTADTYKPQYLWDVSIQMASYDPYNHVYKFTIKNPAMWPGLLDTSTNPFVAEYTERFRFTYDRVGGVEPFMAFTNMQIQDLKNELDNNTYGITFEVDWAGWSPAGYPDHYAYPRYIYNLPGNGVHINYCGEGLDDGPWEDCDPDRYNVDGPVERLLEKGVQHIIVIDTAVGGVRFYKGYDVVQMCKLVLEQWNDSHLTDVELTWVNDYTSLMERSYPTEPEGWTAGYGEPTTDPHADVEAGQNPLIEDLDYALLHVEGIEAVLSETVPDDQTGILFFNHGLFNKNRRYFDPKMNDTNLFNENIKTLLLDRNPGIDPDNIIGSFGGEKEVNPENGIEEYSRSMRGENLSSCYLHEADESLSGHPWGYRYWDGLQYLKDRGIRHIVIDVPQTLTENALHGVELYNQIGKEIGMKTWAKWGIFDYEKFPGYGDPFADYWGTYVTTDCDVAECCFEMGGCDDGRPYPPPRQTPIDDALSNIDPSLAFDVSDYGHLGYDPALGLPNPDLPVQDQYSGTWEVAHQANDDPRVGKILAKHVLEFAVSVTGR
jgi:hypothetical protein